ncbi:MAG: UvrD-helicase domain-containing protein [Bacilli bacterium]|nr:UvrD-helicase domain-containing protein [Bacilli bacterium]
MTKWTREQLEAIEKKGENIIVSAGAGSGKTAVLSERVLEHVKNGINIDEMLILTFTNAAAAEMKDRIRKKISSFDGLEEQLDRIDNAYITTFDAYALSLVKKYNHLLNISDKINIIDDGMLSLKKRGFLEEIFDEYYLKKDEKFLKLINDFCLKDDKDIFESILNISNKLDNLYDKNEFLSSYMDNYYNDSNVYKLIDEYVDFILKEVKSLKNQVDYLSYYTSEDFIIKLEESLNSLFVASSYDEIRNGFPSRLPSLPRGSEEEAKAIKDNISSMLKKLKEYTKDDISYMKETIYKTYDYANVIVSIISKLDLMVLDFKKGINAYEFSDVARLAIRTLKENESIRLELKNTYKEILIDEYQDTNDIQDIFVSLIENNNVYMVGDIKQSIYRFRNANPNLFKSKYESYSKGENGYKIDLNKNFRSRREVIDSINLIFNLIMDSNIGGADYITSHQMIYGNTSYDKVNDEDYSLEVLEYSNYEGFTSLEIEIFTIASDIKKRVSSCYKIMDKDSGLSRDVTYGDFVILMDRSSSFDTYKKIFEYLGIPLTIYRDKAISNSLDIVLVRHILNVILNIDNLSDVSVRYSIMSILRSYLFGLSDSLIFDILTNDKVKETDLYKLCLDISLGISMMDSKEIYDVIIDRFDFYSKINGVGDVHEHLVTLDGIGKIALNLSKCGYTPLMFLDYLKEINNKDLEIKLPLNKEDSNSVKIMTIHTSKGLEYPICYFSGLNKKFNVGELNDKLYFSLKYGFVMPYYDKGLKNIFLKRLLRNDYFAEEISEKLRLFYVALTRAREKIIIVSDLKEDILSYKDESVINDDTRREYRHLSDILCSIYKYLKPYIKNVDVADVGITKDYNLSKMISGLEKDKSFGVLDVCEYEPLASEIVSDRFSKNVHDLYSSSVRENIDFGLLMHRIFEYIDFKNPNYEGLTSYQIKKVEAFINTGILSGFKEVYKEYEFLYEEDGKQMHGIIDLLIFYGDRYAIVDYKLKDISDEAYYKQLNGYRDYIERITSKPVDIYLYSIVDEVLEKLKNKCLLK